MLVSVTAPPLVAQSGQPRPAIVVVNLRFDGEHANVLQASDTAVVAAATSKLLATLRASELVTLVDSGAVATAVAAPEAGGDPCRHGRAPAAARPARAPRAAAGGNPHLLEPEWGLTDR